MSPPPWEVLILVANHLDPKTLAIASCVCKSWSLSMSSDTLWKPICTAHYPSLSNLHLATPNVSFRCLYAISLAASKHRSRSPSKPHLRLDDLDFFIGMRNGNNCLLSMVISCEELDKDTDDVFRFDIDVDREILAGDEALDHVKITWNVILKGWKGVFTMMDCDGKVRFTDTPEAEGWFSEALPGLGCCWGGVGSGIQADVNLGFCSGSEMSVGRRINLNKVSVGILSVVSWRYLSLDDGLRYLQHFLLPCSVYADISV